MSLLMCMCALYGLPLVSKYMNVLTSAIVCPVYMVTVCVHIHGMCVSGIHASVCLCVCVPSMLCMLCMLFFGVYISDVIYKIS